MWRLIKINLGADLGGNNWVLGSFNTCTHQDPTSRPERAPERTDLNTPTKDSSKEVGMKSVNNHTPSILRRSFRLSSQHPPKNIMSDPNTGTQT